MLAATPSAVLALLHRAIARVLSHHAVHPSRVARHWLEAGDLRQAARWFMGAGEVAEQTLRPKEAADFYSQAEAACAVLEDQEGEREARLAREAVFRRYGSPS